MEKAKVIDKSVYLWTDYAQKDLCKSIAPHQWHRDSKSWKYPIWVLPDLVNLFPALGQDAEIQSALKSLNDKTEQRNISTAAAPAHLYDHQKKAFTLACDQSFCLFLDTGTGKTAVMIAVLQHDLQKNPDSKYLVVAPLSILRAAWLEDCQKFAPGLRVVVVAGSKKERAEARAGKADVFVTNFESYRIDKSEWQTLPLRGLVIDESSKTKDPRSQITKSLLEHSKIVPRRWCMSGTPAPNTPLEYFAQISIVDESILGKSFYGFRAHFAHQVGYGGYTWVVSGEKLSKLQRLISHVSYAVNKDSCLDLPDRVEVVRDVPLTDEQRKFYMEMKRTLCLEIQSGVITAANAAVKIAKLRQISSGFIYDDNGEVTHRFEHAKLNVVEEILDEIGPVEQVLIWFNYRAEREDLGRMLTERHESWEAYGEDNRGSVERFKSGQTRILLANPASLGHGVTLVNCRYAVYYSPSYSLELFHQSKDRIYRIGQVRKCQYYHLVAPATIEVDIVRAQRRKQALSDAILGALK